MKHLMWIFLGMAFFALTPSIAAAQGWVPGYVPPYGYVPSYGGNDPSINLMIMQQQELMNSMINASQQAMADMQTRIYTDAEHNVIEVFGCRENGLCFTGGQGPEPTCSYTLYSDNGKAYYQGYPLQINGCAVCDSGGLTVMQCKDNRGWYAVYGLIPNHRFYQTNESKDSVARKRTNADRAGNTYIILAGMVQGKQNTNMPIVPSYPTTTVPSAPSGGRYGTGSISGSSSFSKSSMVTCPYCGGSGCLQDDKHYSICGWCNGSGKMPESSPKFGIPGGGRAAPSSACR